MLSRGNLRKLCTMIDAFAPTCIAASLSKSRSKTDFAISAHSSNQYLDNFPTITSCKAAVLKKQIKPEAEKSLKSHDSFPFSEHALVQIKAERNPEKLFNLFKANAENSLVVESRFAFEDAVSRLAGARRFDLIERLLEHQKALPQGRREGFGVRIILLYGRARMVDHALRTFYEICSFQCPQTVKSFNALLKVLSQNRRIEEAQIVFVEAQLSLG